MNQLRDQIQRYTDTPFPVLILGESGTGKELVADSLHRMSEHSEQPLLTVNCAAFTPELLESQLFGHAKGAFTGASSAHAGFFDTAQNGSLFLDVYSLAGYAQREAQASYELNQLQGFWSAEDYYGFVNTFKYDDEKVVLDKYSLFKASRNRVIYNWLQYFSLDSLREEFAAQGLCIEETYADTAGAVFYEDSGEIAVVAKCCK